MPLDSRHLDGPETSQTRYDAAVAQLELEMIRAVNDEMRGQGVDRIHEVLRARLQGRLPAAHLDEPTLHAIAASIARGTLRL